MPQQPATPKSGQSLSNTQLKTLIPFVFPQVPFSTSAGKSLAKTGRGALVQVTVAMANTDVTLTHNLGRTPILFWVAASGTTYTPQMKISASANTLPQQKLIVQFSAGGTFVVALF